MSQKVRNVFPETWVFILFFYSDSDSDSDLGISTIEDTTSEVRTKLRNKLDQHGKIPTGTPPKLIFGSSLC